MKIYNYHPDTGVYISESFADPDPLSPDKFLIPAYATTDVPPQANEKQQVVFKNCQWEIVDVLVTTENPTSETNVELWKKIQIQTHKDLYSSDIVVLRCYENGIPVPTAWVKYRNELRAILKIENGDPTTVLPTKPEPPTYQ